MRWDGNAAHDDRLDPGMHLQAELVASALASGAVQQGFKAGLGTPAARERFMLEAPLVGVLLDRTRIEPGSDVAIGGWQVPRAEAEIAVRLDRDVAPDATPEEAIAAVGAMATAIELVDLHPAPESVTEALAGNIYHRLWVTGPFAAPPEGHDLTGLVGEVSAMGVDLDPVHELEHLTGPIAETLVEVARMGARHGRGLRRDDVVLVGSVVPLTPVAPGGTFRFALTGYEAVEVRLSA